MRSGVTFVILIKQLFILGGLSAWSRPRGHDLRSQCHGKVMTLGNLALPMPRPHLPLTLPGSES